MKREKGGKIRFQLYDFLHDIYFLYVLDTLDPHINISLWSAPAMCDFIGNLLHETYIWIRLFVWFSSILLLELPHFEWEMREFSGFARNLVGFWKIQKFLVFSSGTLLEIY